jgi:hypothetical protein
MITRIAPKPAGEAASASDSGPRPRPSAAPEAPERGSFPDVLSRLSHEIEHGEKLVGRAVHGGHSGLDAGALIALQAGIYRYSEAVDLAAKMVDRAGAAVKTTLTGSGG